MDGSADSGSDDLGTCEMNDCNDEAVLRADRHESAFGPIEESLNICLGCPGEFDAEEHVLFSVVQPF